MSVSEVKQRHLALVLRRTDGSAGRTDGHLVFADFLQQNSMCFWNACLIRSVASLEYRGCLVPLTLLMAGSGFALEVVRSAWARRVLRPPKGYTIHQLGDLAVLDLLSVAQTQFAPLSEAVCKVVTDLTAERRLASAESIRLRIGASFPDMQIPSEDILHKTLGGLIRERKIYHTGNGYFVVTPDTYRRGASPPLCERPMLMSNEEALVRLHGECTLAVQVDELDIAAAWSCSSPQHANRATQMPAIQLLERSGSFRVRKVRASESKKIEDDLGDLPKSEKQSMLAKLLKRMQFLTDKSAKHLVFSAQFPPLEWLEGDKLLGHSVATQTAKPFGSRFSPQTPFEAPKIPWQDTGHLGSKVLSHSLSPHASPGRVGEGSLKKSQTRPNNARCSPSQRYSHGTLTTKKRHKHRRSSSESPKIHKNRVNGYQSYSNSSKSNADNSDDKTPLESANGSKKSLKVSYKPFDQPEWKRAFNYLSKNEASKEPSAHFPVSSNVGRNVLKDMRNISANDRSKSHLPKVLLEPDAKGPVQKTGQQDKIDSLPLGDLLQKKNAPVPKDCKNNDDPPHLEEAQKPSENVTDRKNSSDAPKPKEITVDNTVSVEVAVPKTKSSISTTIVTEETTVTQANGNSKVVSVTSITTSLSPGGLKEAEERLLDEDPHESSEESVNDLNLESNRGANIFDCSSTCNIETEVK